MKARAIRRIPLLALAACLAGPAAAEAPRCQRNTLDEVFCARNPEGDAIVDDLGSVRCGAGACVEWRDAWHCAAEANGAARRLPDGVDCEGGCVAPTNLECVRRE